MIHHVCIYTCLLFIKAIYFHDSSVMWLYFTSVYISIGCLVLPINQYLGLLAFEFNYKQEHV
jgi:hypothetical protein